MQQSDLADLKDILSSKVSFLHHASAEQAHDYVFVGTTDGYLHKFRIERELEQTTGTMKQKCTHEDQIVVKKGKKIDKIESDLSYDVIFVQCNGSLDMYCVSNFAHVNAVQPKDTTQFCLDRNNMHRLIVFAKKKLKCYMYTNTYVAAFPDVKEKVMPESNIPCLEWYGDNILMGTSRNYSILSLYNDSIDEVMQAENKKLYSVWIIGQDALLKMDNAGIFFNVQERVPSSRSTIAWSAPPSQICSCFPHVIGYIQDKNPRLEIFNIYDDANTNKLDQTETISPANATVLLSYGISKRCAYMVRNSILISWTPMGYDQQVQKMIHSGRYDEAFEMFEKMFEGDPNEKAVKLKEYREKAGFHALHAMEVEVAFSYLNSVATILEAKNLLGIFYPELKMKKGTSMKYFPMTIQDTYADKLSQQSMAMNQSFSQQPKDNQQFMIQAQAKVLLAKKQLPPILRQRRDHLLNIATASEQGALDELAIIDTYLMKLYLETSNKDELEKFLSLSHNFAVMDECIAMLKQNSMYFFMALLYKLHRQYEKSLDILVTMKMDPKVQIEAVSILQRVVDDGKEDLLWKHATWLLLLSPDYLIILKSAKLTAEKVLKYLQFTPDFGQAKERQDLLLLGYLKYLVSDLHSQEPLYHTELALKYTDMINQARAKKSTDSDSLAKLYISELFMHLSESFLYHAETVLQRLEHSALYECLCVLYSRLNQHEQVFKIMLFDIKRFKAAETHIATYQATKHEQLRSKGYPKAIESHYDDPETSDVIIMLLKLCFTTELYDIICIVTIFQ